MGGGWATPGVALVALCCCIFTNGASPTFCRVSIRASGTVAMRCIALHQCTNPVFAQQMQTALSYVLWLHPALQSTTVQCRSVQCTVCTTVQCKSASTCLAPVCWHTALDELFHKPKIENLEWEQFTTNIESPPHSTNLVKLLDQFIPIANWSSLSISGERYI